MDELPLSETSRLSSEIDELRRMADRGNALAIAGGQMCAWWGLVITIGALLEAGVSAGFLPGGIPVGLLVLIAGYGGTFAIPKLAPRSRFIKTWRTQAVSTAWVFAGIGIICISLGSKLNSAAVSDAPVMACICVVFGILLAVMSSSSRKSGLMAAAAGWMIASVVILALTSQLARLLVLSASAIAFMLVPGLLVARSERRAQ